MDRTLRARLKAHQILEHVQGLAEQHGVELAAALYDGGPATRALWGLLRGRGWSAANLERLFGLREPRDFEPAPEAFEDGFSPLGRGLDQILAERVPARDGLDTQAGPPSSRASEVRAISVRAGLPPAPSQAWMPMSAPRALDRPAISGQRVVLRVLQVDELSGPEDSFRCAPFNATVQARACIHRQRYADPALPWKTRQREGGGGSGAAISRYSYIKCWGCVLGRAVATRLSEVA